MVNNILVHDLYFKVTSGSATYNEQNYRYATNSSQCIN